MGAPAASSWDPAQYERFREERSKPFYDLLALLRPAKDMCVVDLGCGTGDLTRVLHQRLDAQHTLGIDSSESMLARAREVDPPPGLWFELSDIATFAGAREWDVVFSNAAIHWLPEHPALLARLTDALTDGGQLAIQLPANHDHPSHTLARQIASEAPFQRELGGWTREWTGLTPEAYATLLDELGYVEQRVRLEVYAHHLASREGVVEWVKGTLLTDYAKRLSPQLYAQFLQVYGARLLPLLADARPYFYPFKRILLWAQRPGSSRDSGANASRRRDG